MDVSEVHNASIFNIKQSTGSEDGDITLLHNIWEYLSLYLGELSH